MPTIRSDLRAPRIKRVCDTKNYGDESDAYGLVNPSIFSRRGVQEKDFLLPRTKEEVSFLYPWYNSYKIHVLKLPQELRY